MASIYSRIDKKGNKKYYGSIYHNGKRIRKFLGNSNELAEAALKKLEYELLFNIQNFNTSDEAYIKNNLSIISTLAKLESIKQLSENDSAPESATALVGEMKILIPLAGLVDKEQEILRLNKEIDKLIKHQQQLSGKLNNKKFISGAPKTVVEKEQSKLSSVEKALGDLELQLKKISSL